MFRKLVSNLPFSPSLINQLGFYSKRIKKEQATRKIGLVFTAMAIVVQSLTFFAPAQASVQASFNDIVYGGGSHSSLINTYDKGCDAKGRCDIKKIYNAFGIDSTNLRNAKYVEIYSSLSNGYYSTGRAPRDSNDGKITITGVNTIFSRTLYGWAPNKRWPSLEVTKSNGQKVWILLDCGNVVTGGPRTEKPKYPNLKLEKSVNKAAAKKGEEVKYTIKVTNYGDAPANNTYIYDDAPAGIVLNNKGLDAKHQIKSARRWETPRFNIAPKRSFTYSIYGTVDRWGPVALTNKACVDFFDSNIYDNCDTATTIIPSGCPIPGKENLPKDDPGCKTNPNLVISKVANKKELKPGDVFEYTLKVTNKGDIDLPRAVVRDEAPEQLSFLEVKEVGSTKFTPVKNPQDFVSKEFMIRKGASATIVLKAKVVKDSKSEVVNTACVLSLGQNTTAGGCDDETVKINEACPTNPNLPKNDPKCKQSCPVEGKTNLPVDDPGCKPCDETKKSEDGKDLSCLELHKKARNITQQIENANGTKAHAGDSIEYTLSVTNKSKQTRKAFIIEENIEDVLEYADIIDANGATYTENPVKMLSWKPVDIRPNETINRTVLVKIKSTIPATPASTSDASSYDMKLFNVYGDQITIELPQNPIKTVEQTVKTIPSTGLGTNVVISTIVLMAATYFFFRSRTMIKELGLIRQQFNYGNGA